MIFDRFYDILAKTPSAPCLSEYRRGKITVRTYAEFYGDVLRVAAGLPDLRGKRALVFVRPGIDLFVALLACWARGAAVLLPNGARDLRGVAVDRIVADGFTYLPARAFFKAPVSRLDSLRKRRAESGERPYCADDDAALVTFTSGSGGAAREITRTFGELGRTLDFLTAKFSAVRGGDRLLITLPTYVLAAFSLGAESVLFFGKKKNAKNQRICGRLLRERRVNGLICSASRLALADGSFPDVEKVFVGGSALARSVAVDCRGRFPNADFRLLYGTSECPVIATADLDAYVAALDDGRIMLGRPADGVRVTVADDGELMVAGALTNGADRATGDLGFIEDGLIYLLGKKNCSDAAHGKYNLMLEHEIERRFPALGPVAMLHYDGENYLFVRAGRRKCAELRQAYPFLRIVRKSAPLDAKHGGKLDRRRAVKMLRRGKPGRRT